MSTTTTCAACQGTGGYWADQWRDCQACAGKGFAAVPGWRPASNGAGPRHWFLVRGWGAESRAVPLEDRYRFRADGALLRFASQAGAQRAADRLNREEGIE